jgi:hypothetical protein
LEVEDEEFLRTSVEAIEVNRRKFENRERERERERLVSTGVAARLQSCILNILYVLVSAVLENTYDMFGLRERNREERNIQKPMNEARQD